MAHGATKRIQTVRSSDVVSQITGSRRHVKGHGLVDQILPKAGFTIDKHRVTRLRLT